MDLKHWQAVASYFREKRLESCLSQQEVASSLGYVSSQYISNVERGLCVIPLKMLLGFIEIYDLSVDDVLRVLLEQEKAYWTEVLVRNNF